MKWMAFRSRHRDPVTRIPFVPPVLLAAVVGAAVPGAAFGDFLYATDLNAPQIYQVDKATGALLQTIPVKQAQDSLIFDTQGNIIYTAFSAGGVGQVRKFNPQVGISSDTLLATIGNRAVDMALAPGGNFVLATSQTTGLIYKVSLTTPGSVTTFGSGQYTGGIVYDSAGRLYAVSGNRIVELDPTTFNVVASSAVLTGLDGLSFDPFTGELFAGSRTVGASGREGFYELSLQSGSFLNATLISSPSFSNSFDPDGLEPDGNGKLYLASEALRGDDRIYQYDITAGKLTVLSGVLPGLDDLAPLAGLGAPPAPEPASLTLVGIGTACTLAYGWRRRKRAA